MTLTVLKNRYEFSNLPQIVNAVTVQLDEKEADRVYEFRRTEIVETALRLLNEVGLEKLSVRGVAQALGMHPPGLYWYIESKQDLIDRMAAAILDDGYRGLRQIRVGEPWSAWLITVAMQARGTLLQYRDGAGVVASAYLFRTNAITPWIEVILEVLEDARFTREQAMGGAMTVLRYTTSVVLDEQLSPQVPTHMLAQMTPAQLTHRAKHAAESPLESYSSEEPSIPGPMIDATQWPRTADAIQAMFCKRPKDVAAFQERHFLLGLELIVAGMQAGKGLKIL